MSRFALLLLGSVMMLLVAACDSGDDGNVDETGEQSNQEQQNDSGNDGSDAGDSGADGSTPESENGTATAPSDNEGETGEETTPEAGTPESGTPQPGPEQGMFFDITFEEANELTPFELREPEEVPEGIEFQSILAMASPDASQEERSEEATTVTMSYLQSSDEENPQGLPVELTQTIEMDMTEGLPQEAEQESVTVGDRETTRVTLPAQTGDEIVAYMWQDGDVYFSLAAIMGPGLETSELESMVASVPTS